MTILQSFLLSTIQELDKYASVVLGRWSNNSSPQKAV